MSTIKELGQYPTQQWAAEAIVESFFPSLGAGHVVLEPGCGPGAFLSAVPAGVQAIGVEIDPLMAERARRNTGCRVIEGDFRTVEIDVEPTHIIGNPPFILSVIDGFLDRAHELLPHGGAGRFHPAGLCFPDRFTCRRLCRALGAVAVDDPAELVPRPEPAAGLRHLREGPAPHDDRLRAVPGDCGRAQVSIAVKSATIQLNRRLATKSATTKVCGGRCSQ